MTGVLKLALTTRCSRVNCLASPGCKSALLHSLIFMKREIKAFIFDLDGVITDTAEYHYQAWKRLADEENIPFAPEDYDQLRGVSRRRALELLLGEHLTKYSEEQILEMMDRKNGYYQKLLTLLTRENFLPGIPKLLKDLKNRGIKIAIGSASKNTRTILSRLGVLDEFDAISDGYSAHRAKPAPDVFLHAAKLLGLKPEECVVVEDAEAGVEAALQGGMITVGIGPKERVGKAHYCYPTTAEIDVNEILGCDVL